METRLGKYKRYVYIGLIAIALGIAFRTVLQDTVGSLGTVFVAVGGLFLIIGMSMKRKENEGKNK